MRLLYAPFGETDARLLNALREAGHVVEVTEAAPEIGGMAAHFDLDGLSIERFYHFVCKDDQPTFDLLAELGIGDKMRWRATSRMLSGASSRATSPVVGPG